MADEQTLGTSLSKTMQELTRIIEESDDEEEQVEQFRKFLERADPEDFAS